MNLLGDEFSGWAWKERTDRQATRIPTTLWSAAQEQKGIADPFDTMTSGTHIFTK